MSQERGFTLMELMVVVMILGALAAFAVPQYLRAVEISKADDAVSLTIQIGTANKMFALGHKGFYAAGDFTASCGAGVCPVAVAATQADPCVLVWCEYLVDQDWANRPYGHSACDGAAAGSCAGLGSGNFIAGARRNGGSSPYSSWGFTMSVPGTIAAYNGAPAPTY